jgi:hypothetical protein
LPNSPPPLVRLVLGLFVAWAGAALAYEIGAAPAMWDARELNAPPLYWRLGMTAVDRLQACLSGAAGQVPRDSVVVFASPPGPFAAELIRSRWAAYMLADAAVTTPDDPWGRQLAGYLVSYRVRPQPPPGAHLELLRRLPGCRLFRIVRP